MLSGNSKRASWLSWAERTVSGLCTLPKTATAATRALRRLRMTRSRRIFGSRRRRSSRSMRASSFPSSLGKAGGLGRKLHAQLTARLKYSAPVSSSVCAGRASRNTSSSVVVLRYISTWVAWNQRHPCIIAVTAKRVQKSAQKPPTRKALLSHSAFPPRFGCLTCAGVAQPAYSLPVMNAAAAPPHIPAPMAQAGPNHASGFCPIRKPMSRKTTTPRITPRMLPR